MVYNVYMIRKQFYITPELDRALTILARDEGKSVAEVHREILARVIKANSKTKSGGEVLLEMAANAFKGPGDLSTNLFDYLYGEKSPNYGKNRPTLTKAEEKRAEKFINEHRQKTSR